MISAKIGGRWILSSALFAVLIFVTGTVLAAGACIAYKKPPSAKISKVSYYIGKWKKQNTVIFEVTVKNIAKEPKRFKVTVDIPDGPSASYLYPRTGKPPVIKPGSDFVKPMPMVFQDTMPTSFSIIVTEVTQ